MASVKKVKELYYVGRGDRGSYLEDHRKTYGLSHGRIDILLEILSGIGVSRVRSGSDEDLKAIFADFAVNPERYGHGLPSGAVTGLSGASIADDVTTQLPFLEREASGERQLSENGLRAFRDLAANFDDVPVLPPDLGQLQHGLADLEQHLRALHALASTVSGRPGMGHNHPPKDGAPGLSAREIDNIRSAVEEVRAEIEKPDALDTADVEVLERARGMLAELRKAIKWAAIGAAAFLAEGYLGAMGASAFENPQDFIEKIDVVSAGLQQWVNYLRQ